MTAFNDNLDVTIDPKRVRGDEGEVESHSIRDQISADKYAKSKSSLSGDYWPIKRAIIKPPGAF